MIHVEHPPAYPGVALILLDRREKRNALTPDMLRNLRSSVEHLHTQLSTTRCVVLAGEGDVFCAGFDLAMCRDDELVMAALLTRLSETVRSLRRLAVPVVGAAHGAAIAGGCALLGGCDIVVTDAHAKLGYPVVRLGVSPAVASPLLRSNVGMGRARERLLDPGLLDGREAVRIGLAHHCAASPGDVRAMALDIATALAAKPAHAIMATKRWLNELEGSDRDEVFDAALAVSLATAGSAEERERLAELWRR